jgi:plasmid stabilization system protein ParE
MGSDRKIFWTEEAIQNLESIFKYLSENWSQHEMERFKKSLSRQIELIIRFPKIFPKSETHPRLRKAVLSRQTIIFYELEETYIYIVYLFNTFQNPGKIQ